MQKDSIVTQQNKQGDPDMLTQILRQGAQNLLARAIQIEVQDFLLKHYDTQNNKQEIVKNGFLPQRNIQTGIGPVQVQVPRVRDRAQQGRLFHSDLIPPYQRRTLTVRDALPILYLKGLSTGQFPEALKELFGSDSGLSPSNICRLKEAWQQEYQEWSQRDLSAKRFVYVWADGIYFSTRLESDKQCLLVLIGVDEDGNKTPLGISDGMRESHLSWKELLLQLQSQGLQSPCLAIGDGALGFWKALQEVYPSTEHQRCWVHKMANVLDKLPASLQTQGRHHLQRIWGSQTQEEASQHLKHFELIYGSKYEKAVSCLKKDKEALLKFFEFPAEHWRHIRSTNLIESTFATVRLRTQKTRGCLSRTTALSMVFKLLQACQKRWKGLQHADKLKLILEERTFVNGELAEENSTGGPS